MKLLVMCWRNGLKKHSCFASVNVIFNPIGPCFQPSLQCNQTIHVLVIWTLWLHVIPPAQFIILVKTILLYSFLSVCIWILKLLDVWCIWTYEKTKDTNPWREPLWLHQWPVLKDKTSASSQYFPFPDMSSNFRTLCPCSASMSTRYGAL